MHLKLQPNATDAPREDNGETKPDMSQESRRDRDDKPERDDICRDFLKNICNRGNRCKFYHPPETQTSAAINFCIDFQNRDCLRDNCRFVHASRDEVERYKHTREVTLPLARAIAAVTQGNTIAGIPVCKEFQSSKCARGAARCRYWHVNIEEERDRRLRGLPPSGSGPPGGRFGGGGDRGSGGPGRFGGGPPGGMYGAPMGGGGMRRPGPPLDGPGGPPYDKRPRMFDPRVEELERKNSDLSKEIDSLKRELQREHERYEDLYALFRQQGGGQAAPIKPASSAPTGYGASGYGGWNSGAMGGWQ